MFNFQIDFTDPASSKNYYAVSLKVIEYLSNLSPSYPTINSNNFFKTSNTYVEAALPTTLFQVVFSDKTFNGLSQTFNLNMQTYYPYFPFNDSTIFYIKLHSISKAYYDYAISFYKQKLAEKDFYAEPVSVYSNIEGGYGIFAGYSTSEVKIKYVNGKVYY